MAEYKIEQIVVTNANKLPDLEIKNAQLIFIKNLQRIALDFNGERTFYNEIVQLATESERTSLLDPVEGLFYFVIESAVLWTYQATGWIPITSKPDEIIYIGDDLPELGIEKKIYINKAEKNISIWDGENQNYIIVSDCTNPIGLEEITNLFN